MIVIPSIFIPEDWSFTFYEGLNRHPDSIFQDKTVAELGCGNGWISIAIADKWSPSKVVLINNHILDSSCNFELQEIMLLLRKLLTDTFSLISFYRYMGLI